MKQDISIKNILLYNMVQHLEHKGMFVQMYEWGNADMQLMHAQDFIFMRFADVLLMHSEITKTATGIECRKSKSRISQL